MHPVVLLGNSPGHAPSKTLFMGRGGPFPRFSLGTGVTFGAGICLFGWLITKSRITLGGFFPLPFGFSIFAGGPNTGRDFVYVLEKKNFVSWVLGVTPEGSKSLIFCQRRSGGGIIGRSILSGGGGTKKNLSPEKKGARGFRALTGSRMGSGAGQTHGGCLWRSPFPGFLALAPLSHTWGARRQERQNGFFFAGVDDPIDQFFPRAFGREPEGSKKKIFSKNFGGGISRDVPYWRGAARFFVFQPLAGGVPVWGFGAPGFSWLNIRFILSAAPRTRGGGVWAFGGGGPFFGTSGPDFFPQLANKQGAVVFLGTHLFHKRHQSRAGGGGRVGSSGGLGDLGAGLTYFGFPPKRSASQARGRKKTLGQKGLGSLWWAGGGAWSVLYYSEFPGAGVYVLGGGWGLGACETRGRALGAGIRGERLKLAGDPGLGGWAAVGVWAVQLIPGGGGHSSARPLCSVR